MTGNQPRISALPPKPLKTKESRPIAATKTAGVKSSNDNLALLKTELAEINRQIAAIQRLQKLVGAVDDAYQRVGGEPAAIPEPPRGQSPKPPEREADGRSPETPNLQAQPPPDPQAPEPQPQPDPADIARRLAAVERIRKIVAAVEKGYRRVEQGAPPEPPEPQGPKMEKRPQPSYAGGPEAAPMPDSASPADKSLAEAQTRQQEQQEQARKAQEAQEEQARVAQEKSLADQGQQHRDKLAADALAMQQQQDRLKADREAQQRLTVWLDVQQKVSVEGRWIEEQPRKEQPEKAPEGFGNAGMRYAQSMLHYDPRSPYQSLAKAAVAEHAAFKAEQESLSRQIVETGDPKERQMLELLKKIEGYDYLAITGDRIAGQSYVITGRADNPDRLRMLENVAKCRDEAKALRQQYRDLQAERTAPQPGSGEAPGERPRTNP